MKLIKSQALIFALLIVAISITAQLSAASPDTHHSHSHHKGKSHKRLIHKAEWMGAGAAAGQFAGPAGSAGVGIAKYRHDLKASGHRRKRALVKIGAPIAAGAVAGPVGTAGYEAYDHRRWIKHHIFHSHSHHRKTRH